MKSRLINAYARVRADVFGAHPESFINALAAKGTEMWNVMRVDDNTLSFDAYEQALPQIEILAEEHSVLLKVKKYREETRRIMKTRYKLLLLAVAAGLVLFISSLFIWQIEIHGESRLSKGEILRALEDGGVYVGSFWPAIKADKVRGIVMPKLPEIGWMTVNISGSRAVVLLNERQPKPKLYSEEEAASLLAAKTGILRRVSALNGLELVKPGQAVTVGEVLVDGRLGSVMGKERFVCARGSVMADTWSEINAVCPEEMDLKTAQGIVRHRFAIVLGKRRINLYISSGKAIDECDKIISNKTLGMDGHFALPIRFVHEKMMPYESSPGVAYDREAMGRSLLKMLDKDTEGQILQSSFTESYAQGLYVLTLRAHCVENIAIAQKLFS